MTTLGKRIETGVPWLTDVPASWTVSKLGHFLREPPCYGVLVPDFDPNGVEMLRINDMTNGRVDRELLVTISVALSEQYHRSIVQAGDIALTVVGTIGVALEIDDALAGINLSRAVARIQVGKELLASFARWLFGSPAFDHYVDLTCVGTAQRVLNMADVTGFVCAVPPMPEQAAITAFLDRETGKIDALVEEQRRFIGLLKEKRQAVISHAVTKGLNPNVPMKDSGVEWLGNVPEHWEMKRLAHLARRGTSITYGIVQAGPDVEGGIPYIRTSDMSGGALPLDGYLRTAPEIDEAYARSRVQPGDVVIAIRATIGKPLIVPQGLSRANLTQGTAKFSPSDSISAQYVCHFLRCDGAVMEFDRVGKGATFKEITLETLRKFPVLRPPLEDQLSICHWLETQTSIFDRLIAEASQALSLLSERRAALISAAVTGKIDVRNFESVEMAVAKELAHADL